MAKDFIKQFLIPIPHVGNEGIHHAVEELAKKAGIDTPHLYTSNGSHFMLNVIPVGALSIGDKSMIILNHRMLNDTLGGGVNFANHASIGDELKSVLAHEMGHIKRGDLKPFGIARIAHKLLRLHV